MRFLRRSLTGLFLFALTAAFVVFAVDLVRGALQERMADDGPNRPVRERVFAVTPVEVTLGSVSPEIVTFGEIQSRRSLEIRAPASGEIVWRSASFEDGAPVLAGQTILKIDPQDAIGRRDTAEADLAEAEADLRDARRSLEIARSEQASAEDQAALRARALARQRDLLNRGVGTEAAVETAELAAQSADQAVLSRQQAVAQAEARVDQTRTMLDRRRIALAEAERRLAETEITAEFTGVLDEVAAVEGGLVAQNERLAVLVAPEDLEVAFTLSTGQYARLMGADGGIVRAPVSVSLDVADIDIVASGRITRESPAVGAGQTGRRIFARLEAARGFRPGDFVTVRVTEPQLTQVATLPSAALDASETVLMIGEDDRLRVTPVELLRRQGDEVIVRAPGLAGQIIVSERTPFLGEGIKVRAVRPKAENADSAEDDEMVELDEARRARLIAFIEASEAMPPDAKERVLGQLRQARVPARTVARIEARMGS
ncbi:efflux RND transporter periplasmic adaptor subunit [Ovoidimarina sediminis]|uniref:efflux RND transporter periplasmic adaptor subunit n=1 Tax=Ovoidimarina sediminis TaxID=3079856 RepID=UPI00290FBA7F|nr:HlyD family efflux transporter periplasmic adaptor subunit [Rhodophyticola sp. MJ-SS7]MDU8943505.1 efflux transporter periplasmic adaptor subunit [Rhodophyticola sp. MJ-SS7]